MPTILTNEFLTPYIREKKRHNAYDETIKISVRLSIHADGESPGTLIKDRRPSESETIQSYREKIWVAITEPVISRIITSLSKIRRSSDWSIKYDTTVIPNSILPEETLEQYCEQNYPTFGSVTKWVFDVLLKTYLVDPNAIIMVMTDNPFGDLSTYRKPYALIFDSERVYDYIDGKYAVLYSTDKSEYKLDNGKIMYDGDVYYTCDAEVIQRWKQINAKKDMALDYEIKHGLGRMPAFKVGGVFHKAMDKIYIYKSRINATVPHLNEAVREYSDLQAEVVQHIHSEKWTYETQRCIPCNSTGKLKTETGIITCDKCSGKGTVPTSPYTAVVMQMPKPGETGIPGGIPFGYVQKQVEIVKIQDERVDKHKYQALCAINMEYLAEVPLNNSGEAKKVDRDELNTFVNSIAEDLVAIMDKVYAFINDYRYSVIVSDKKARLALLPKIAVPQNYDLLSSDYLLTELQTAKTAKLNPVTCIALEIEFTNKKFNNDPVVRDQLKAVFELDPLPGLTEDEKIMRLQNDGITQDDYVISCNIFAFVARAIQENPEFLKMKFEEKQKVIKKYAAEIVKANSAKADILPDPGLDPNAPVPNPQKPVPVS